MKTILSIISIFCVFISHAQTVTPTVINSAGGTGTFTIGAKNYELYYSIGEPCMTTLANSDSTIIITQGFLQPFGANYSVALTHNTCSDKNDGSITVISNFYDKSSTGSTFKYFWTPTSVCPSEDCQTVKNLAPGSYSVSVVRYINISGVITIADSIPLTGIVVEPSSAPCLIEVFNGLTPNEDGINDYFHIANIDGFLNNKVEIYNRWGQQLAEIKGYNNETNNWKGTLNGGTKAIAPSGTYFYIIDLGNDTKPIKGWLELTSNK